MIGVLAFWRTLHAFLVRDLIAQFGRHNIGFLWVVLEPMILCTGVSLVWHTIKPEYMHGVPVLLFVVSGYMPLTLFRHLTGPFSRLFRRSVPLMVHRQLGLLDIFLSKSIIEFTGSTMAFGVTFGILYFSGLAGNIDNFELVLWGLLLLGFLCLGIGACIAAASELSEAVGHFIGPFQYLMVPLTPTFYMIDWLPQIAQDFLYYNPFAHPYEMIRAGFFGSAVETHFAPEVSLTFGLVALAVGLWGIEAIRDRLHDA